MDLVDLRGRLQRHRHATPSQQLDNDDAETEHVTDKSVDPSRSVDQVSML